MKRVVLLSALALLTALPAWRVTAAGEVIDETVPPGANYDKAEFRLWLPSDAATVRAVVILTTGSNGDGRPMAEDAAWQRPHRGFTAVLGEDLRVFLPVDGDGDDRALLPRRRHVAPQGQEPGRARASLKVAARGAARPTPYVGRTSWSAGDLPVGPSSQENSTVPLPLSLP